MAHGKKKPQEWRPLPDVHLFNQLNEVVDVTDRGVESDDQADADRLVARNAAGVMGGIGFGGSL